MNFKSRYLEISVLLYPNALPAVVHGLTDLFRVTNHLNDSRKFGLNTPRLRVTHWQAATKKAEGVKPVYDSHPELGKNRPKIVIVPPSLDAPISSDAAVQWLITQHASGTILCSICSGAILLAETGLLAERIATTHWTYANEFAKRFPDIKVDADRIVIDDGDIITAGGLMAWTDLGLTIITRLISPSVMSETARFMLLDPPGREQRYYSAFSPELQHGDQAILKVQHWLRTHLEEELSISGIAKRAKLGERTFLRRFHKATGLKPTEYIQHLRVEKARGKLEFDNQNIEEVAWSVGYEDSGAFRKIFQKIVGLTPGEYRSRFGTKQKSDDLV